MRGGEEGKGGGGGSIKGVQRCEKNSLDSKTCLKKRRANANFIVEQGGREQKNDITFFQRG